VSPRDLDALIAKKVMGWEFLEGSVQSFALSPYSTDIGNAWLVVEKLRADAGYYVTITAPSTGNGGKDWAVRFGNEDVMFVGEANNAPMAICLAALKAVGAEVGV
jgi:hypothetical protein